MPLALPKSKDLRKLMAFGSGLGIEIGATDLEVVAARVRPSGVQVLGRHDIANFAERPAAEWGAEYTRFAKSLGMGHISATVLLPRRDVVVRQIALPGVAGKDMEAAIRFQLDTLHPYGDQEICWGWTLVAPGSALVGIARRETVDRYHQLFNEAGIAVSSFTFSAAAVHAAIRLNGVPNTGFVALSHTASGAVEVYGESEARPVFSAEFAMPPQRATVLALSELRLPPETEPRRLEEVLPQPVLNPITNDLSRNALPYATALAGACPRLAPAANILPAEFRRFSSRAALIPTLILAGILLLAWAGMAVYSSYADRQYLQKLETEIAELQPRAVRAGSLDDAIASTLAQTKLLDNFRRQTHDDMDALNELTKLVEPPAWVSSIDLNRDSVRLVGEAPQASPLMKIIDSSPLFEGSTPDSILRSQSGGESLTIRAARENRR